MSYPSQPGQDPNNPYAQQPQGQPGYGSPQQDAGLPSYGGGADPAYGAVGVPTTMPSPVKTSRIMLYVTGGLSVVGAVLMFIAAAAIGSIADDPELQGDANLEMLNDLGTGLLAGMGVLYLAFAVAGILLAAKFAKGGNGVRIGAIVYSALVALVGLLNIASIVSLVFVVMAILVIVFVSKADGKAWFDRPRH
ncbi:hypothetical protein RM572_17190 [Streptomyces sp. DSM 42041]|uniref:DUF4064 domain-containing protein n=1 Tax=Streptomyces hazeniae TaxID=3075538 RepID=A0ABU2NU44_9ACTN|nr:hypothetical protein [Streptomyces sp. DSM 42041]MDT0380490.1 hypothetical protein [Streptomyces sp. DSM 42041]